MSYFSYLPEKQKVAIKLGQIISHQIVKPGLPHTGLRSPEELNILDRMELASMALQHMPEHYLEGEYDRNQLLEDVARYIDQRIPQSYVKWLDRNHATGPAGIKVQAADYGLAYHYEEHVPKRKTARKSASPAASANPKNPKKEKPRAQAAEEPAEETKSPEEQIKDANFSQLQTYLRKQSLYIEKNEFKALLFVMNGMTIYHQTKASAIDKGKDLFTVPKVFLKTHIDAMGLQSERYYQNKKQFGKMDAIATSQLKKKLNN